MKYGVGIDVSKGESTVMIMNLQGEVFAKPFKVKHTIEGMQILEDKIKDIDKDDIKFVMEDTGNYHLPIFTFLLENGYCVVSENALKIKKYLDRDLRKNKNDKSDSIKLANYACENWFKLAPKFRENEIYSDMRFLARQYNSLNSSKAQLKIDFSNLCDLLFPGFYQLLDDNTFYLGLVIFRTYFHPDIVKEKSQSHFINEISFIASELGHGKVASRLANEIYSLACSTLSVRPNNSYSQLAARELIDALTHCFLASESIIAELSKLAKSLPEFKTISSLPGCGPKLTPLIIAEIGDIRRFKNAGSIIAFAGIDTPSYQSGSFSASSTHITKRGNKYLRCYCFMVIKSIIRKNSKSSTLKDFIYKKLNEGKLKKVVMIAGINKFLRIYFGSIKELYSNLQSF